MPENDQIAEVRVESSPTDCVGTSAEAQSLTASVALEEADATAERTARRPGSAAASVRSASPPGNDLIQYTWFGRKRPRRGQLGLWLWTRRRRRPAPDACDDVEMSLGDRATGPRPTPPCEPGVVQHAESRQIFDRLAQRPRQRCRGVGADASDRSTA